MPVVSARPSISASLGTLLEMEIFRHHQRLTESQNLEVRPNNAYFMKSSRWHWYTVKHETAALHTLHTLWFPLGFPGGTVVKNPPANAEDARDMFDPWVRRILWRRASQSAPVFLPEKSHGQRNLAGYSPWGRKELNTTEQLSTASLKLTTNL